jgi:ABC-2 type transport system permease protein
VAVWTLAAYLFGRSQFEASLRFDEEAAQATPVARTSQRGDSIWEKIFRLPSAVFSDPLGGLIEKELRFLCRAPRFRLLFFMGFSFGLLIWMPAAYGKHSNVAFISQNFLTFVSVYSLMLLGQVLFYNSFGFDRSAAQLYFVVPVRFRTVLLAKNITAALFVLLEILAVIGACLVLWLPVPVAKVPESFCVALILSIYLLGAGNLASTYYPSAVDPGQSWRQQGGRLQAAAMLFILYPLASIPISLAYLARWAFDSSVAFYLGLAIAAGIGAAVYWVATDSALEVSNNRREQLLAALSKHDSPISVS